MTTTAPIYDWESVLDEMAHDDQGRPIDYRCVLALEIEDMLATDETAPERASIVQRYALTWPEAEVDATLDAMFRAGRIDTRGVRYYGDNPEQAEGLGTFLVLKEAATT